MVPGKPGNNVVPGPGRATNWVAQARDTIRQAVRESGARHIQLFMAAPAGVALSWATNGTCCPRPRSTTTSVGLTPQSARRTASERPRLRCGSRLNDGLQDHCHETGMTDGAGPATANRMRSPLDEHWSAELASIATRQQCHYEPGLRPGGRWGRSSAAIHCPRQASARRRFQTQVAPDVVWP